MRPKFRDMPKWWKNIPWTLIQALAVRAIFVIHCVIVTYRVVIAYNNTRYWLLTILIIGIAIETVVTLWKNGGNEWKWFSPGIFFYLVAALPSLWLLEIQLMNVRLQTALDIASNSSTTDFGEVLGVNIPISLDLSGWALAMEQALLFILIIGRWVLPKGDVSRDQLSQILLVFLGMAADIMELFEVFKEDKVIYAQHLIYPILSLWSWSLLQYTLMITSTKARKTRFGGTDDQSVHLSLSNSRGRCCSSACCTLEEINADIIGIITTIVMQDGPFLCFRMYLLVGLGIVSQMMIFFTCKNLLVLLLQIYRLIIIYLDPDDKDEDGDASSQDSSAKRQHYSDISAENAGSSVFTERPNVGRASGNGDLLQVRSETPGVPRSRNRVSPSPASAEQRALAQKAGLSESPHWTADSRSVTHRNADHIGKGSEDRLCQVEATEQTTPGSDDDLEHPHSVGSLSSSEEGYCSYADPKRKGRKAKGKQAAKRVSDQNQNIQER